ncbi:MAG: tandem-95 repeat protein [Bellilinea sp.]
MKISAVTLRRLLCVVAIVSAFLAVPNKVSSQTGTKVTLPASSNVFTCQSSLIPVRVENVTSLTAYHLEIDFVPGDVQVTAVENGGFIPNGIFEPTNAIDNVAGTVVFGMARQNYDTPPANGSGVLVYLSVQGVNPGAAVNFTIRPYVAGSEPTNGSGSMLVGWPDLTPISFTITNGTMNTQSCGSTDILLSNNQINENSPLGSAIGTFTTIDPDGSAGFSYAFWDTAHYPDNVYFTISGNELRTNAAFNYEADSSYTIRVSSSSEFDPTIYRTFTITITDANDPPVLGMIGAKSVNEHALLAFTATATDEDALPAPDTLTYSLANGTSGLVPAGASIVSNSGAFPWPPAEDQGPGTHTFDVCVSDGLASDCETITVTVNEINAAPGGADSTVSALEDIGRVFATADFGFSDPDDVPAKALMAVKITTLPAAGWLRLDGVDVSAGQSIAAADILAGRLVFTPAANVNGAGYASFTFQVQDDGGTVSGGIDLDPTANTLTIDVTPVNDAPAGTDNTPTILEDGSQTFGVADFGFSDLVDSPANNFSAVKITTLPGQGSLTINAVPATTGQIVSVADITAGKLVFTPAANGNGNGYASFTFQVQDDGGTGGGGNNLDPSANTMTINVTPVNDPPAGADKTVTILEDAIKVFAIADFEFSDPADIPANALLAVKISPLAGAGLLTLNDEPVIADVLIPVADIIAGQLVFTPYANASGSNFANFTFQLQDDGGIVNSGVDLDPTANTIRINVTSVNDAPAGTDKTLTILEDSSKTFAAADFGFSDPIDLPKNTFSAVIITTLPGPGSLKLNGVAVTAGQAIPAGSIPQLVYTPAANGNGNNYGNFTFQVQDNGGTANGGVDLDASPNTMAINVTSVSDAPVGTNNTLTILEDSSRVFASSDFGYADPNDTPANAFSAIRISGVAGQGSLTLNSVSVTADQVISIADITAGKLVFTPAVNANGAGYASFTFKVQDDGGTLNGGINEDPSANTLTIDVTPVNDAPSGENGTVDTNEDTDKTFAAADFPLNDANDTPPNTLAGVKIASLPSVGTLKVNGASATTNQVVTLAELAAGALVYSPALNGNGAGYASFTFQVQDNGGDGDNAFDPAAKTMTINVASVNDAPVGANNTVTILEDGDRAFASSDFGFSDSSDTPANTFSAVKISPVAGSGTLTYNLNPVTIDQVILVANIPLLVFTPEPNANGAGYASFTFQVQDDGGTANFGVDEDPSAKTMTIDVTPVNDAPTGGNSSVTIIEDTSKIFAASDFPLTDAIDSPAPNTLGAVKIVSLPLLGTLKVNSVDATTNQVVTLAELAAGALVYTPALNGNGAPYASFTFQVRDDGGIDNSGVNEDPTVYTMTINVTGNNNAPVADPQTPSVAEDTATPITLTATDVDNDPLTYSIVTDPLHGTLSGTIPSLTYTPDANYNGPDSFTFKVNDSAVDSDPATVSITVTAVNDPPVGANTTIATNEDVSRIMTATDFPLNDANDNPAANTLAGVRIVTLPSVGTLKVNNVDATTNQVVTLAELDAGALEYTPAPNGNGLLYTSFTFQVQDNGGDGDNAFDPVAKTMTINVTLVNDAPTGADNTVAALEDGSKTFASAEFGFSDVNDNPANAFSAVKITTLPAKGSLKLGSVAVVVDDEIPYASIPQLVFTPAANANGTAYASFTFKVKDNGGILNNGIDLDPTANTMTINVTSVNDAPAGTNKTVEALEDGSKTFASSDFGFSDVNDNPANAFSAVKITTLPGQGSLKLDGVTVSVGSSILVANIPQLVFTPDANEFATPYTSFTFQVQDNGSTTYGGLNLDPSANTMTINVTSVNDAPVGADNTVAALEDGSKTFASAEFGFSDVNDNPANAFSAVKITTLPAKGSLKLGSDAVVVGDEIPYASIPQLVFTPAANANGNGYTSFTFQVKDNGGTLNNGIDLDPSAKTMTINVTSVNDAPSGVNRTVDTNEDTDRTFAVADFPLTDANDTPSNTLAAIKIVSLPLKGTLKVNGANATVNQIVSLTELNAGKLVYSPALNGNGSAYASFNFQVQDNGGTANGGVNLDLSPNTMTINVTAVNDAPVGVVDFYAVNATTVLPLSVAAPGVLENDSDVEGSSLSASLKTDAVHGKVAVNPNGSFTYNPDAGYAGTDSFIYTLSDGTTPVDVQVNLLIDKVAPPVAQWLSPVTALAGSSSYYGITYDASTATVPLKVFVDGISDVAKVEFRWYDHTQTPGVWQVIGFDDTPTLESGKNVYTASLNMDSLPFTDQIQVWAYTYDAAGNYTRIVKVNGFDYWARILVNHNPTGYNVFLPFIRR